MVRGTRAIIETIRSALAPSGLDLIEPFIVQDYNARAGEAPALPTLGRARTLGILVGNTRAFWRAFLREYAASRELRACSDPVDRYAERAIDAVLLKLGLRADVRYADGTGSDLVAMQLAAEVAGLAHLAPCGLSIHPEYGPWIAFRAVLIVDTEPPSTQSAAADTCTACAKPCMQALAQVRCTDIRTDAEMRTEWRAWLAVRDACPLGRAHRYDDRQIEYHYTKNREVIDDAP